ncbi:MULTISPECIES: TerY-C metal binding domain-containing protein [Vitreoscilla]|uniref:VWA domain-containing protein n=1 Tax=Vitreoscilla stercoraria TaxID=61 RepID=A0ABY4EBZ9_VITST|nr:MULTISPECIES: TerY-C metal binding domain-containing protein [Vitreoscilla]AUZ05732.2 hypothetical protein ADP71_23750 [Vitreoscilla sp. C1]UOO92878.1 VWA domain-containing protein [Vitreoscilla stercoraria]
MRRLPIFLVIDVSESMMGDNLRLMQEGMDQLTRSLRQDPYALEMAYLSVIAFAGQVKTLAPLTELISFYPPRLPLGAGSSIGKALNYTMDEIQRQVVCGSATQKGDFKPVVFLMSDGGSTDATEMAVAKWERQFKNKATLVSLGIGPYAQLSFLSAISEQVLRLEQCSEQDFKQFIAWISASVSSRSRSIGLSQEVDVGVDLEKPHHPMLTLVKTLQDAVGIDENYVILSGLCQTSKLPYLMKYEKLAAEYQSSYDEAQYQFTGVYAAQKDYFEWSDERQNFNTIHVGALSGGCGCPHCGAAYAFATCSCGQIFCVEGDGEVQCPGCEKYVYMGHSDGDYEVTRSRG